MVVKHVLQKGEVIFEPKMRNKKGVHKRGGVRHFEKNSQIILYFFLSALLKNYAISIVVFPGHMQGQTLHVYDPNHDDYEDDSDHDGNNEDDNMGDNVIIIVILM